MTIIPPSVCHPDFRFILVKVSDKIPLENYWTCPTLIQAQEKWQQEKEDAEKEGKPFKKDKPERLTQYRYDDPTLQKHLNEGGNYGIVCGQGGLIVADVDRKIESLLPPDTLTIATPSQGTHYYFICPHLTKKIILDVDGIHYGEIQAGGNTQIIGPGCKAKSKLTQEILPYTITKEAPIKVVSLDDLKDLFGTHFKKPARVNGNGRTYVEDRYELPIERVIDLNGFKQTGSEYLGPHPIHGSKGGHNFSVNTSKNVWHCFRHDCGGGVLEYIGMKEGIIGCGHKLNGDQFNLVLKTGEAKYGLRIKRPTTPIDMKLNVARLLATNKLDEATEEIVRDLLTRHHIYTIRDDKAPEMWIYHEGIYTPHGKTYILSECREILDSAYSIPLANSVVNKIMADTFIDAVEFFAPNDSEWICVENGQLNPFTGELKEFNPSDIHFTKLPVTYDPAATCPGVEAHFREVTGHENDVKVLEEITGWFLLNEYKPERAIMLSGNGRNGKGKTILLWKEFLGIDNVATIALHQFEQDQYAAGDLLNKRANLAGDLDAETLKNTGLFKQVTGRDPISSNRKYLSRIKFMNNAKMVCAANELPHTRDMSVGFFGRWVLIDFPYRFGTQMEIDAMGADERKKAKLADLDIANKITTPQELSGLLNLAVKGLQRLMKQGDFSTSMTTEQVKREWLKRSDSFGAFMLEYLKEDYGKYISKQELRHVYGKYCSKNKLRVASDRIIKDKMSEILGVFEGRKGDGDARYAIWEGVSWNGKVNGEGGEDGEGFSKSTLTRSDTFRKSISTFTTLASGQELNPTPFDGRCHFCGEQHWLEFKIGPNPCCRHCIDQEIHLNGKLPSESTLS